VASTIGRRTGHDLQTLVPQSTKIVIIQATKIK